MSSTILKEKSCTGCKEAKAISEFHKCSRVKSGYRNKCKTCTAKENKDYYKNNPDKVKLSKKKHYDKKCNNPIHGAEYRKIIADRAAKYRQDNPDFAANYRKTHIEERRIKASKYRSDNVIHIKAQSIQYRKDNRDAILIRQTIYRRENSEFVKAQQKKYNEANPEMQRARSAKRRAAKLQRTVTWSNNEAIKDVYKDCEEINLAAKTAGCIINYVVDHIIPLQGELVSGLHVENNLQIITAFENHSKNNKFTPGRH